VNTEDTGNAQPTEQGDGLAVVGKRLAATRQDQERNLSSVAADLHLGVDVVAALETGDEAALPGTTFIRGYIKAYARLLGLDGVQLLAMLPVPEGYRPAPLRPIGMRRKQINFPLGKGLLWLLVLGVLVIVVVYGIPAVERLLTQSGPTAEPGVLPLPLQEVPPEPAGQPPATPPIESQQESLGQMPVRPPVEPPQESASVVENPVVAAPAPLPLPAESGTATTAVKAVGPAEITLRFSQDSWVEMESHGHKLVVGTQPAGSERTLQVEPPVQILLGNAPGVVVEYRGKPVDLKPYRHGRIARLVLED